MLSKMKCTLTHDVVSDLQEAFRLFDSADEGVIAMSRVRSLAFSLVPKLNEGMFSRVLSTTKLEGCDVINFPQFVVLFSTLSDVSTRAENFGVDELVEVFSHYDTNRTGYIDLNCFLQIMMEEGELLSAVEGSELVLHLRRFGCVHLNKVNYCKFVQRLVDSSLLNPFSHFFV
ncbi:EF-hand domain containing protein, putative [Trypanosoma equiperdum]|uniref:EF-hand domain-containing protein n=2 Tax=Trypanozoon TaxID=39700 RepID=Q38C77_TRYB2|nr:hypothetical protein, conserved [Trypanosoma brucei brucei TREU927]EAN77593.1 hypothetical protein, conserved [Trypanosoma brucei brucei TREU927]SCU67013.1 EF-hand domain containing protein, putative [Trypanosoma equiperdum]